MGRTVPACISLEALVAMHVTNRQAPQQAQGASHAAAQVE
jgi:hypothetical protein